MDFGEFQNFLEGFSLSGESLNEHEAWKIFLDSNHGYSADDDASECSLLEFSECVGRLAFFFFGSQLLHDTSVIDRFFRHIRKQYRSKYKADLPRDIPRGNGVIQGKQRVSAWRRASLAPPPATFNDNYDDYTQSQSNPLENSFQSGHSRPSDGSSKRELQELNEPRSLNQSLDSVQDIAIGTSPMDGSWSFRRADEEDVGDTIKYRPLPRSPFNAHKKYTDWEHNEPEMYLDAHTLAHEVEMLRDDFVKAKTAEAKHFIDSRDAVRRNLDYYISKPNTPDFVRHDFEVIRKYISQTPSPHAVRAKLTKTR
eukprot:GFYU01012642.1.p1 GENE.GFYU01012642.1~~GFYU01012642.1.p1  ORF type:complete len:319 (-),score=59.93 GFYU01012642.1:152-1084(-)